MRAAEGNVDAFNALVSRWEKRIYNYLLRLTRRSEDSFDLAQDVFLKAYQNLKRLGRQLALRPLALPDCAQRGDEPTCGGSGRKPSWKRPRWRRPASSRMAPIEVALAVESALGRLSAEQREAVVLKVYEGFKFDEIAAILECPASTVKSRVYTGLELLKGMLAPVAGGLPGGGE